MRQQPFGNRSGKLRRGWTRAWGFGLGLALASVALVVAADSPKPKGNVRTAARSNNAVRDGRAPAAAPATPKLDPAELDAMLEHDLAVAKVPLSPVTNDADFLRRVYLDLTGKPPTPDKLDAFCNGQDPDKRSAVIDTLLATDDYARHWARYWRDVFAYHAIDQRARAVARGFEDWMFEQLKKNVHWDKVATELITATGPTDSNGRTFLIFAQFDQENTPVNLAAETSRVFLGIQIQCAQCHDHPYDQWKREQFHEMTAFFARTVVRRDPAANSPISFEVTTVDSFLKDRPALKKLAFAPVGKRGPGRLEHQMPDKEDPEKKTTMHPKFLLGQETAKGLADDERRRIYADYVTAKDNYWFARAYVNRIWGELMGEGFYEPVDDLGPERKPRFPMVINRLAAEWRASDYDVQWLFRTVMNSRAYQRQIRPRDPSSQSPPFASVGATRLRADQIFDSLLRALGIDEQAINRGIGRVGGPGNMQLAALVRSGGSPARVFFALAFGVDPSMPKGDILGTLPSALLLMNGQVNQAITAQGDTLLGRLLPVYENDDEVVRLLYKRALARAPTDRELATARAHIQSVGNREEAFEDLLWCLINSTEFITKR
jgi:hypothetical protein